MIRARLSTVDSYNSNRQHVPHGCPCVIRAIPIANTWLSRVDPSQPTRTDIGCHDPTRAFLRSPWHGNIVCVAFVLHAASDSLMVQSTCNFHMVTHTYWKLSIPIPVAVLLSWDWQLREDNKPSNWQVELQVSLLLVICIVYRLLRVGAYKLAGGDEIVLSACHFQGVFHVMLDITGQR